MNQIKDCPYPLTAIRERPCSGLFQRLTALAGLPAAAVAMASAVALPVLSIFLSFLEPDPEIWDHLVQTLLARLLGNTAVMSLGVVLGTSVIGIGAAWLTAVCDFPGRKIFTWALLLPLAVPTYVLAFVFIGLLDFSGPVQSTLRIWWPGLAAHIPDVRSAPGVIAVMTMALYPYVYLLARSAFKTQGRRALEAVQSLGVSRVRGFFYVALPMARPWIATGLMLVLMETLADFGAVSIFNFDTFTTAIYKAWYGFFSLTAAAQLAALLVVMVFLVTAVEQMMRSQMRFTQVGRMSLEQGRIRLVGWSRWAAFLGCAAVVSCAFLVPVVQLALWSLEIWAQEIGWPYFGLAGRSLMFGAVSALLLTAIGLVLAYVRRLHQGSSVRWMLKVATLGYALPGTVLAVGIVQVMNHADGLISGLLRYFWSGAPPSLLQGTLIVVFAAYTVRFMTVAFNTLDSAMHRITPSVDEAAISLGTTGLALLRRVHLPILKSGVLTAALLVLVDVMKEMPITLMTRPFGWDTLAVKIYELTSEGEWQRAALPAMLLVITGLLPVILLMRQSDH